MIALEALARFLAYACVLMVLLVVMERIIWRETSDIGAMAWIAVVVAGILTVGGLIW